MSTSGNLESVIIPRSGVLQSHDDIRKKYLELLCFEEIETRLHRISASHIGTCDWILQAQEWASWLKTETTSTAKRLLWIVGRPGSGKSVLLRHIFQKEQLFDDYSVAAFFFCRQGFETQRTSTGLWQSLLYQLLRTNYHLLDRFINKFPGWAEEGSPQPYWSEIELQDFLIHCAMSGWLHKTVLLIDAIDECDENHIQEVVTVFQNMMLNAISNGSQLYICISQRNQPITALRYSHHLNIDKQIAHQDAIRQYVHDALTVKALTNQVVERCEHNFLWAKLVVGNLNDYFDSTGCGINAMLAKLNTIPSRLDDIFSSMLPTEAKSKERTVLMLKIAMCAWELLSPRQLYALTTIGSLASDPTFGIDSDVTNEEIEWLVRTQSRGLLQCIPIMSHNQSLDHNIRIQFLHESVRDYARHTLFSSQSGSLEDAHEDIVRICFEAFALESEKHEYAVGIAREYAHEFLLLHLNKINDAAKMVRFVQKFAASGSLLGERWRYKDRLYCTIIDAAKSKTHAQASYRNTGISQILKKILHVSELVALDVTPPPLRYKTALSHAVYCAWYDGFETLLKAVSLTSMERSQLLDEIRQCALEYKTKSGQQSYRVISSFEKMASLLTHEILDSR